MKFKITWLMLLCGLFFCIDCIAYQSMTQTSRYMTLTNKPSSSQVHLLSQIIQVQFPQHIQNVGEAMDYLLHLTGYALAPTKNQNNALKITLNKPLPLIDRSLGPISLRDGLTTLAGRAFTLTEDPINRTVNFTLKKSYRGKK